MCRKVYIAVFHEAKCSPVIKKEFTIKDTWTKPRGRVGAREEGGFDWGGGDW